MGDEAEKDSGAEEYIALEIALAQPLAPEQERSLRDALEQLDPHAFDSIDVGPAKISLCYDPTRTSKEHLLQILRQAGGKTAHVESGGSPLLG